jgi:phospholipid transport system substrate-binding protein
MRSFPSDQSRRAILIDRRSLLGHSTGAMVVLAILSHTSVAQAAGASDPTAPIQQLNAALLAAMKAGQARPFTQRYAILAPAVERAFDLNAVLRAVVGLSWDSLPGDQKVALAGTFHL